MLVSTLCKKEVVDAQTGEKLGYVDDVRFDPVCARALSIIVYGKGRFLGIFGRDKDAEIPWEDISVIGDDTVLIKSKK